MSRLKRFAHGLLSSYALLGLNVLSTLISVPLALHYLSKAEFGLWALTTQVAFYISLIDLGTGTSLSRILIEHKDQRTDGSYGSALKTALLVSAVQGMLVLFIGLVLVKFMGGWLRLSSDIAESFLWLMAGQIVLTAASFLTRTFTQILIAWQRIEMHNYAQMVQMIISFAALWIGFSRGLGVYSLLLAALLGWLSYSVIAVFACQGLGFLPGKSEWGQVSGRLFREFFHYSLDIFFISIGAQIIMSSQTILVTRALGMEASALWTVMTKPFNFLMQFVLRIFGNSMPVFAEMQVRGEQDRLWKRYWALFTATSVLGGVCAMLFVACNGPFIDIWTRGKFAWPRWNDVLLGAWLVVMTQQCCHNSLIISLKQVKELKYTYLVEGLVFIFGSTLLLPRFGMTGMLACSLACTLAFTWTNGVVRVARMSGQRSYSLLWSWQRPLLRVLFVMTPCWLAVAWLLQGTPAWLRLGVLATILSAAGALASMRLALPQDLKIELMSKLPRPLRHATSLLTG